MAARPVIVLIGFQGFTSDFWQLLLCPRGRHEARETAVRRTDNLYPGRLNMQAAHLAKLSRDLQIANLQATEDPSRRRINGGLNLQILLHMVPMSWPEIVSTPNGPAITHSNDFSLVTTANP